jgi:Domain of unknown function (DUF4129)
VTRAWDELTAAAFDIVPPGVLLLVLIAGAALAGALWYWWPAWVPKRWPRLPKRHRKPRKTKDKKTATAAGARREETVEPVAAGVDTDLADRLAAEGRYAEAIRQRLRVTLGELVAARLVPPQPGWTAAELASMASGQRPTVAAPLGTATELFSEVWYGRRPAGRSHDEHMKALTDKVRTAL